MDERGEGADSDEDDLECLKTGYLQVLSERDCGNRKVIFYFKAMTDCYKRRENLVSEKLFESSAVATWFLRTTTAVHTI